MTIKELAVALPKNVVVDAIPDDCVSVKQIAEMTNTSVTAVSVRLKKAGILPAAKVGGAGSKRPFGVFKCDDVAKAYNSIPTAAPVEKKATKSKPAKTDGFGNPA